MIRQLFVTLTAFTALATANTRACATTTAGPSTPTPPANDPFWSPPGNFGSLSAGQVFNCRQVNWKAVTGASAYYQYAYKSQLRNGTNVVAVATLLIPSNNANGAPYSRLLSYQIPYDSPTSFCGPSFVFTSNAPGSTGNTYGIGNGSDAAPVKALQAGIPVVITDYESITAGFSVGASSGRGTLNGIEAVVGYSGLFQDNPSVALWGYSGGALATEFALELATSYTPTYPYQIIGAALGGLTPVGRNVLNLVNGPKVNFSNPAQSFYPALVPYVLLGVANEDADVSNWIQNNLRTDIQFGKFSSYKDRFKNAKSNNCNIETAPDYTNTDFNTWFNNLAQYNNNFTFVPVISNALDKYGVMGNIATPTVPMYFYKGTGDEVSNVADTNALYTKYCGPNNNGARIIYQKLSGDTHSAAQTDGLDGAWNYLLQRYNGVAVPTTCQSALATPTS